MELRLSQRILLGIGFTVLILWSIGPIYWAIATSLTPTPDLMSQPIHFFPQRLTAYHYERLAGFGYIASNDVTVALQFRNALVNSIITSVLATVISVFLATLGGYAFARLTFPGRTVIFFVVIATIGILIISVLLVLAPILARLAEAHIEWIKPYMGTINSWRYVVASTVIVGGLFAVHYWLPAGRRPFLSLVPGILFTLVGWLIGSTAFASYLDHFSSYVTTYAGLASIMVAVVFLYIVSAIFILGGEFNAVISRYLEARARVAG